MGSPTPWLDNDTLTNWCDASNTQYGVLVDNNFGTPGLVERLPVSHRRPHWRRLRRGLAALAPLALARLPRTNGTATLDLRPHERIRHHRRRRRHDRAQHGRADPRAPRGHPREHAGDRVLRPGGQLRDPLIPTGARGDARIRRRMHGSLRAPLGLRRVRGARPRRALDRAGLRLRAPHPAQRRENAVDSRYRALEEVAENEGRGLWGECSVPPC